MQLPCHSTRSRPGLLHDVAPQVLVGGKNNRLVCRNLLNQTGGVGAGADDVAHRLDVGGAVNVRHHNMVGVLGFKGGKSIGGAAIGQGNTRR